MRNAQETRRRLLDVTAEAIAAAGSQGVRVDQIAAQAQINKRMIYHYFGDKDGLCAAVLARQLLQLADALADAQLVRLRKLLDPGLPTRGDQADADPIGQMPPKMLLEPNTHSTRQAASIVVRSLLDLQGQGQVSEPIDFNLVNVLCRTAFNASNTEDQAPALSSSSASKVRISLSPVVSLLGVET